VAVRFVPNPAGIKALAAAPPMVATMGAKAQEIEERAKSLAPVETGRYRDSIRAEADIEGGTAVGRVSSDVPYAVYIEYGTSDTPVFAPLRRALGSTG
jgi:hypothetical protein